MGGNGTGNVGDGNGKPPQGFDLRGLVDAWAIYYCGFFRCQKTSLTAFRSSIVARCHAIERNLAIGSPFSSMMAITATLVVFHLAARASACVRLMAVFTSAAVLLISSRLPPICFKMQVKLVMAPLSFLGVLVCGCAHHTSPIRRAGWIIQHRGKLFPNRLGIAQERSGACSVMLWMIVDSRGISGAVIGMRGYVRGYGRRLESNDMEWKRKTPAGDCPAGVGVVALGLWASGD